MTRFALSLHDRQRLARAQKARYHRNPAYRLAQINRARTRRGAEPILSLEEMGDPRVGRQSVSRDEYGRFAPERVEMAGLHVGLPAKDAITALPTLERSA